MVAKLLLVSALRRGGEHLSVEAWLLPTIYNVKYTLHNVKSNNIHNKIIIFGIK